MHYHHQYNICSNYFSANFLYEFIGKTAVSQIVLFLGILDDLGIISRENVGDIP